MFAFASIIIAPFLIPNLGSHKNFKKSGIIALAVYTGYLMLGIIALLFLIPSIGEINNTLSIYILSRRVNFGSFIQRIDAVFILIWIMSIFNYLAITMHFSLDVFKRITNIKYERALTFCFSAFLFTIALIPKTISDINLFERTYYKYLSIVFVFGITMVILICAYFKKKNSQKKGARVHYEE
ncbi:MAG: GerAB/ArcD/ProY family transporter [Clostridia bacterium]|nr:GerAB/ArcD/ProY family transporter [Clostridia bacterium]